MKYKLLRSKNRRKSISLRVNNSGEIVVRAPTYTPKLLINHFVKSKMIWISKQQNKILKIPKLEPLSDIQIAKLKVTLGTHLAATLPIYAKKIGVKYSKYRVTNVKSYWGTCSTKRVLSFNLRLAKAPTRVINNVIIHELCHLKIRGHNKRFWTLVKRYDPHFKSNKKWLRENNHLNLR